MESSHSIDYAVIAHVTSTHGMLIGSLALGSSSLTDSSLCLSSSSLTSEIVNAPPALRLASVSLNSVEARKEQGELQVGEVGRLSPTHLRPAFRWKHPLRHLDLPAASFVPVRLLCLRQTCSCRCE